MGIDYRYGEGEAVRLSVRPMRARMAATRQVARPAGLSALQKPVLEHSASRKARGLNSSLSPSLHDCGSLWENSRFSHKQNFSLYTRSRAICPSVDSTIRAKPRFGTQSGACRVTTAIGICAPLGHSTSPCGPIGALEGGCASKPPPICMYRPPEQFQVFPCASVTIVFTDGAN
jgi:hypothetical protein